VIIGHSLGAVATLAYLSENRQADMVGGFVGVASFAVPLPGLAVGESPVDAEYVRPQCSSARRIA
jgi:predicted alpha/beta hydrolase family esterase